MTKQDGIYKCEICGNVISVVEAHDGELVCCGKPMELLKEKTSAEEGKEKHVPLIKIDGNKVTITVGSIHHPMEAEHYIELIQIIGDGKVIAGTRLNPGEEPKVEFNLESTENIYARALCNVHGLWRSE